MRVLVLAAAVLAAAPARAEDAGRWDARLTAVSGAVTVRPADGSADVPAEEGTPLEEGDRVIVPEGGEAEISLDGGSLITVAERSEFLLEDTRRASSVFGLTLGALLAKIEKLGDRRLSVRTGTAVAAVRGTEFGVETDGESSGVGVFDEGRVEVSGESGASETLGPNRETSVRRGGKPAKPGALKRFLARRARMRAHAARLAAVRQAWRELPAERRRALRRKTSERITERPGRRDRPGPRREQRRRPARRDGGRR